MLRRATEILLILTAAIGIVAGCVPVKKPYAPPEKTGWKPEGCRSVPAEDPVLGSRSYWRNLHSDAVGSDEVSIALAPVFEAEWTVEPNTFNVTGPVFDAAGNLYFSRSLPLDEAILISLDPSDGSRRWAIEGAGMVGGTPMVLADPEEPGREIVYLGLYDRALAVGTDGVTLWDVSTGLTGSGDPAMDLCLGIQYLPGADAIVGLTRDGHIYALDRTSGEPVLETPHSLPGEKTPPALTGPFGSYLAEQVTEELGDIIGELPPGFDFKVIFEILGGSNSEVTNHFSIDPHTGRMWVAATAPDGEDGVVDGVSEVGALFGLDMVPNGGPYYEIVEGCHRYFPGGSASTPSLSPDGSRVYIADGTANLIAVDGNCDDAWSLDIGEQIRGSVGVASDNGEIYVPLPSGLVQVIDQGTEGIIRWRAELDMYFISDPYSDQYEIGNVNLASIGANGIGFQGGAGPNVEELPLLTLRIGTGILDRETGKIRYFGKGVEGTAAVMSTGPDGALYLGNSPIGRAMARVFFEDLTPPLTGGITKYGARRLDLLIRDAACAAADRAANAHEVSGACPDSAEADIAQIRDLIAQCRSASAGAIADGDLTEDQWASIDLWFRAAERKLEIGTLDVAASRLSNVCDRFP